MSHVESGSIKTRSAFSSLRRQQINQSYCPLPPSPSSWVSLTNHSKCCQRQTTVPHNPGTPKTQDVKEMDSQMLHSCAMIAICAFFPWPRNLVGQTLGPRFHLPSDADNTSINFTTLLALTEAMSEAGSLMDVCQELAV